MNERDPATGGTLARRRAKIPASPGAMAGGKAYATIKALILQGEYGSGERLKEHELTARCNVSRTPIREALSRLAAEGLVVMTPNSGAQVSNLGATELEEVYTLRSMVESHAASRAASRITAAALLRLDHLAGLMEQAVQAGADSTERDFTEANSVFHHTILEAALSPRLSAMAALVIEVPLALRTFSLYSRQDKLRSLSHHRELIEALQAGDAIWSASVMKSHVHAAYQALLRSSARKEGSASF